MKRTILLVEHDQVMRGRVSAALAGCGHHVESTDRIDEIGLLVDSRKRGSRPIELVIVAISDRRDFTLVSDAQKNDMYLPFFTLRNAEDKSLVIELLDKKHDEFIDHYISLHARAHRTFRVDYSRKISN
jgi:DNA-binding NtrC family response regulator